MEHGDASLKTLQDTIERVSKELAQHEYSDAKNLEYLKKNIPSQSNSEHEDSKMGMDNISDKVNINVGEGRSTGGAEMAALVAALGQRNQGNDHAALIAALGNRNDDSSNLVPFMAMMGDRRHDDGINNIWPIILLALLGRGRHGGGIFGGDSDCGGGGGDAINQLTLNQVLAKLGTLEGAVPLGSCEVQNSILEQTNALSNILNQNNIAQLVAHNNTKDAVTTTGTALLQAGNNNTQSILCAINGLSSKMDSNTIMDLQRQLGVAQARETEERHHSRIREVEVNVSQQVNQQQAQAQFQTQVQSQLNGLLSALNSIAINSNRSNQDILNLGTMLASGTQTPTTTQVNR